MEVSSTVFIGAVIIATTQFLKELWPDKVNGAVTIAVAAALGLAVAVLDRELGLDNITPAIGILTGLGAVGVHSTARQIG